MMMISFCDVIVKSYRIGSYMVFSTFHFEQQVIVLGTGLTECILSGLLSVEGNIIIVCSLARLAWLLTGLVGWIRLLL